MGSEGPVWPPQAPSLESQRSIYEEPTFVDRAAGAVRAKLSPILGETEQQQQQRLVHTPGLIPSVQQAGTEPLAKVFGSVAPSPETTERILNFPATLARERLEETPDEQPTSPTLERIAQITPSQKTAAVVSGAGQALADTADFFTSPLGIATLGTSQLPVALQRGVALTFSAQMASQVPEIATQLGEEIGKPEDQRDYHRIAQLTTEALVNTGFSVAGAVHGTRATKGPTPFDDIAPAPRAPEPPPAPKPEPIQPTKDVVEDLLAEMTKGQVVRPEARPGAPAPEPTVLEPSVSAPREPEAPQAGAVGEQPTVPPERVLIPVEPVEPERLAESRRESAQETPQATPFADLPKAPQVEIPAEAKSGFLTFIEEHANRARQRIANRAGEIRFGSGPLHEVANITDWAIIGAEKLARGTVDFAKWSGEMLSELGDRVKPHLAAVYRTSLDHLKRAVSGFAEPKSEVQRIIERETFLPKQGRIEVGEKTALKTVLKTAEKAGEAGRTAGAEEARSTLLPKIEAMKDQLAESVSKARALHEYFRGREMGGAEGRKVATEEAKQADTWLEAEAHRIQSSLTALVRESLPPNERSRFINRIIGATRRPALIGADPEIMYRRAAQVAAGIERHAQDVHRKELIADIRKTVDRALDSPKVDIGLKRTIRRHLYSIETGRATEPTRMRAEHAMREAERMRGLGAEVFMPKKILEHIDALSRSPLRVLPTDMLETLRDKLRDLEKEGRNIEATREEQWRRRRGDLELELARSDTRPIEQRYGKGTERPAGDPVTALQRLSDAAAAVVNRRQNIDRALLPIDALFNEMDSRGRGAGPSYSGFLSKRFKGTVNWNRQRAAVAFDAIASKLDAIRRKHRLAQQDSERIGIYALLQQKGVRDRLLRQGETPETLNKIVSEMTPGQLEFYHAARNVMEDLRPQVTSLMHRLYNIDVKAVENYWPLQRDWEVYSRDASPMDAARRIDFGEEATFDELGTWNDFAGDYQGGLPRTKTEQGFTIERKHGMTAVKVNAFEVLQQHLKSVSHLLAHQEDLKMMGEIARSDLMRDKFGRVGQKIILDWLDTVARDGRADAHQRWASLDAIRRSITMGIIPWNPVTMLVHTSQIPVSMAMVGPNWFRRGAAALLTSEGRQFVRDNMRTLIHRAGSEPAIAEAGRGHPFINMLFGPESIPARAMAGYGRFGTLPIRLIDTIHSMSTALGGYMKELARKGINPSEFAKVPVDEEALNRAMAIGRRTVASVLPEDLPQVLSRGKFAAQKSGNISAARTALQFGNTYLDIWSVIRHDLLHEAVPKMFRSPKEFLWAGALGLAIAGSIMWEAGIRHTVKQATTPQPKKDDTYDKELAHELLRRFPFMGNLMAMRYGETGIPVVDTMTTVGKDIYHRTEVKKLEAKERANIKIATDVSTALGVPGASFIGRMVQKQHAPEKK